MTYPAGTDLATSFQDGQPQPLSNTRLTSNHVGEFCCGIGGMETTRGSVDTITQQDGNAALLYSGNAIGPEPSAASSAVLPASGIWVKPGALLSYWVYPEAGNRRTSTYVVMDALFTDGTYLHDLACHARGGGTSAPVSHGPLLQTNTWQQVALDIGAVANGKQLQSLVFSFGSGDLNGPYRGFVDSVAMTHSASR